MYTFDADSGELLTDYNVISGLTVQHADPHGRVNVGVSVKEGDDATRAFDGYITKLINDNRHLEADDIIARLT
jgi:hypothetical protein